jgi:Heterokaryon incompatibility protein (HET)
MTDLVHLLAKKRLFVKPNLYKALRHLRQKKEDIAIWVDAVCINQVSEEEKKKQVPNIAKVYNNADRVCIWLGSADHQGRTNRAMAFIHEIVKAYDVEELIIPEKAICWSDLIYLMRKSWFSRRWVIQELALATEAVVHCGDKEVHWRDFADAIGLFTLHFEQIHQLFKDNKKIPNIEYNTITDLNPLGAKILVDEISNVFLKNEDGRLYEPLKGLETLISTLATFDCSDPRDTVHALLNIAKETSPFSSVASDDPNNPVPKASYSRDLLEVYTDFVRWVIKHSNSLDIICRPWALPERKRKARNGTYETLVKLPSWIKVVPESTHGKQTEGFNGRKNGDSFVGVPGTRCYNASHGIIPQVSFGMLPGSKISEEKDQRKDSQTDNVVSNSGDKRKRKEDHDAESHTTKRLVTSSNNGSHRIGASTMNKEQPTRSNTGSSIHSEYTEPLKKRNPSISITGFKLSTVSWKTDPIPDGVIPEKGLSKLGWERSESGEFTTVPDKVWRTLVADRGSDGKNPPSWYHRACLRCLVQDTPNGHINTQVILNSEPPPPKIIENFLKRVQAVTWNRVVLEAKGQGDDEALVGIGPPRTEQNDIICILFGCSVPCILRPRNNGEHYEFIGEAYIYGKMDGEAVSSLSSRNELQSKTEVFRII